MKHNVALYCLLYMKNIFQEDDESFDEESILESVEFSQKVLFHPDKNFLIFEHPKRENYGRMLTNLKEGEKKTFSKTTIVSDF
jgi:hypothetical protein